MFKSFRLNRNLLFRLGNVSLGILNTKMLQINIFEAITWGFTQMEVLILWLWFQKLIKQDKGSNSKHNSKILATLTTTTQKRSHWNLTTLLPKLQISDDHSFLSVMQENRKWKPQRASWWTHRSVFVFVITSWHLLWSADLIILMYPLVASNVLLRLNLGIQSSDIDSLSGDEAHYSSSS